MKQGRFPHPASGRLIYAILVYPGQGFLHSGADTADGAKFLSQRPRSQNATLICKLLYVLLSSRL